MGISRTRLKESHPELHDALERSWEIAFNEWLPALGVQYDSFNSYPHLRNLEIHLDKLVSDFESMSSTGCPSLLNPIELYVMLSAILFHDIGRTRTRDLHGMESERIIRDNFGSLGIVSEELANTIARICGFHDLPTVDTEEGISLLSTVVIDPYGEIRERGCAVLLKLIDHLDSAFTRVLPEYIKSFAQFETVGGFRKTVRGVEVDLKGQMVKVVLGKSIWKMKTRPVPVQLLPNWDRIGTDVDEPAMTKVSLRRILIRNGIKDVDVIPPLVKGICRKSARFGIIERAIARHVLFLNRQTVESKAPSAHLLLNGVPVLCEKPATMKNRGGRTDPSSCPWEHERLLAVLMGNTRENVDALQSIRAVLSAMGIPIRQWFLEYDEHLFNEGGEETCEPIFYKEYLMDVARNMWDLSTEIFGQDEFSYETLAGQMCEPDVEKIRRAVHRLGVLVRDDEPNKKMGVWGEGKNNFCNAIWVGQKRWKWQIEKKQSSNRNVCRFASIHQVVNRVRQLVEPTEGQG
jgi:hypothetical protein